MPEENKTNRVEVGDMVHWTHTGTGRKTLSMSRREGRVISIDGDNAVVKQGRGREVVIPLVRLRLQSQPSQITELLEAMRGRK